MTWLLFKIRWWWWFLRAPNPADRYYRAKQDAWRRREPVRGLL